MRPGVPAAGLQTQKGTPALKGDLSNPLEQKFQNMCIAQSLSLTSDPRSVPASRQDWDRLFVALRELWGPSQVLRKASGCFRTVRCLVSGARLPMFLGRVKLNKSFLLCGLGCVLFWSKRMVFLEVIQAIRFLSGPFMSPVSFGVSSPRSAANSLPLKGVGYGAYHENQKKRHRHQPKPGKPENSELVEAWNTESRTACDGCEKFLE